MAKLSVIGKLPTFNQSTDNWDNFIEKVNLYFTANDIKQERRVPVLLTVLAEETYDLLKGLVAPEVPGSMQLEDICKALKEHLAPPPRVIPERTKFFRRLQEEGETIADYNAALRKLSSTCKFKAMDEQLRDRLVSGLYNTTIQSRVLEICCTKEDIKYSEVLDAALAIEHAQSDTKKIKSQAEVHKVRTQNKPHKGKSNECFRCMRKNHTPEDCFFKDKACHTCGKIGHIPRACRSKENAESVKKSDRSAHRKGKSHKYTRKVHEVEECSSEGSDCFHVDIHSVKSNSDPPIDVHPKINGKKFKFELDTGSKESIMPLHIFETQFSVKQLKPSTITFSAYGGHKFAAIGKFPCTVKLNGQTQKLDLIVVKEGSVALFGRAWFNKLRLNWAEIHAVKAAADVNDVTRPAPSPTTTGLKVTSSARLQSVLDTYSDVFGEGIGKLKGFKAKLNVPSDAVPKFCKARNVPFSLKEPVKKELENLERQGIIVPVTYSDWATPIVPVPKPNRGVRICADFKVTINPVLKADQYPLPRIDDIFSTLAGGEKFSKIDLRQAYLHYEVEQESQKFLTINTEHGLFRYTRLLYGVKDAPSKWQRAIEQVLAGIPNVKVIIDDMIITGRNDDEHFATLRKVLQRLRDHNLRANLKKCAFFQNSVEFCGHVIDAQGLHETDKKVDAITSAKRPENVTEVQAFCGLVNYYRKFLPNISHVLRPLYELTEKSSIFVWSDECQTAFDEAKRLVASKQVLTHYDPQLPVIIQTDACEAGISGVMSHVMPSGEEKPVVFLSRALSQSERNYSQLDREALAIHWTIKKLYRFLFLKHFTLVTDCQALTSIFNPSRAIPTMSAQRLQRYAIFLSGMDYEIKFRKSSENSNADALSRLPTSQPRKDKPDETDTFMINHLDNTPLDVTAVRKQTLADPVLRRVFQSIQTGHWNIDAPNVSADELKYYQHRNELTSQQGCIMRGIRVIIPKALQNPVLEMLHESHCGISKMKLIARAYVWWPSLDKDIEALTAQCNACSVRRKNPPQSQVHPWEFPQVPWFRLHLDFAGPIEGKQLLVLQDAHSKYPEVRIMTSITSEKLIDELHDIFATHGLPCHIHTDNLPIKPRDPMQLLSI